MAVTGREESKWFFAFQIPIVASASAKFINASRRAFWVSVVPFASASWSATRFHIAEGMSTCQKVAVCVCSLVRTVLVELPSASTSLRSWA